MIIHTTNILAAPLVMLIWAIDVYLFLVCIRLLLGRIDTASAAKVCHGLRSITDPLPMAVQRAVAQRRGRPVPSWAAWLIVILATVTCRCLIVGLLFSALR
jgi:uncharacterized protein YggT (Ycf19 family)